MPDLPCPAIAPRDRELHGATHYMALFLLDGNHRLSGAIWQGRILSADQASELWAAHSWEPAKQGQCWPADVEEG